MDIGKEVEIIRWKINQRMIHVQKQADDNLLLN